MYNRHYWDRDYEGFLPFFAGRMFTEPHSTKAIEDFVAWGLETDPATLADARPRARRLRTGEHADGVRACAPAGARHPRRRGRDPPVRRGRRPRRGDRRFARHGRGGGHAPHCRDPVLVNRALHEFIANRCVDRSGMRAIEPAAAGYVERDGVTLHWEEFGAGEPTIALLPTWSIAHSRHWKFQVPYLARHHRVVTFDGRGCGLSDRPVEPSAYGYLEYAADALAVLDATETDRAVVAGLSLGAVWSLVLAADEPERVLGVVCLGPAWRWPHAGRPRSSRSMIGCRRRTGGRSTTATTGSRAGTPTSSSSSSIGSSRSRTRRSRPTTSSAGPWRSTRRHWSPSRTVCSAGARVVTAVCERVGVPVLVIHGDHDEMAPHAAGSGSPSITGGQLVTIAGGGHGVQARDPVVVNHAIKRFVDRVGR